MDADDRGVVALAAPGEDQLELIFWQIMLEMEFDPREPGPVYDPDAWENWELEQEHPPTLEELLSRLHSHTTTETFSPPYGPSEAVDAGPQGDSGEP